MSDSFVYVILVGFVVVFAAIWIPLLTQVHHADKSAQKSGDGGGSFAFIGETGSDSCSGADCGSGASCSGDGGGGG